MNKISDVSIKAELNAGELKQVSGGNTSLLIEGHSGLDELYDLKFRELIGNHGLPFVPFTHPYF